MRRRRTSRERENFRLVTGDVVERQTMLGRLKSPSRRAGLSRYISAGGTRDTRKDSLFDLRERSLQRFIITLTVVMILWGLFYWL